MHHELGALALHMRGPEGFQLPLALPFNSCAVQEYFVGHARHNNGMK